MSSSAGFVVYSDSSDASTTESSCRPTKYCTKCLQRRDASEFFVGAQPLSNIENTPDATSKQRPRNSCIGCSNKRKVADTKATANKRRKSDENKLQSMLKCTWEKAASMIDNGCAPSLAKADSKVDWESRPSPDFTSV